MFPHEPSDRRRDLGLRKPFPRIVDVLDAPASGKRESSLVDGEESVSEDRPAGGPLVGEVLHGEVVGAGLVGAQERWQQPEPAEGIVGQHDGLPGLRQRLRLHAVDLVDERERRDLLDGVLGCPEVADHLIHARDQIL